MRGTVDIIDRDREARRHLWRGLKRMEPRERVAFLRSLCAARAGEAGSVEVRVTSHSGTTGEAYHDVMAWSAVYGGCLFRACEMLESWLRTRGTGGRFVPQEKRG